MWPSIKRNTLKSYPSFFGRTSKSIELERVVVNEVHYSNIFWSD